MTLSKLFDPSKIYNRLRFYDNLPLSADDLLETEDLSIYKNTILGDNLLGNGIINNPEISLDPSKGVKLSEPAAIYLDGDIFLVQSDTYLLTAADMKALRSANGTICILAWQQQITSESVLRNYGGLDNKIITNDVLDNKWGIQVTTRYQWVWYPLAVSTASLKEDSIELNLIGRDANGDKTSNTFTVTSKSRYHGAFLLPAPKDLTHILSDMYLIPIATYQYDSSKGSSEQLSNVDIIRRTTSDTQTMYYSVDTKYTEETDITIPITLKDRIDNIVLVTYNGVALSEGQHYKFNKSERSITLLGFTTRVGDEVVIEVRN